MAGLLFSPEQLEKFRRNQEVDLAYSVPGLGRFRCNVFQQRGTVGLCLRVIPTRIRSIDELGLPPVLAHLADRLQLRKRHGARERPHRLGARHRAHRGRGHGRVDEGQRDAEEQEPGQQRCIVAVGVDARLEELIAELLFARGRRRIAFLHLDDVPGRLVFVRDRADFAAKRGDGNLWPLSCVDTIN